MMKAYREMALLAVLVCVVGVLSMANRLQGKGREKHGGTTCVNIPDHEMATRAVRAGTRG